MSPDPRDGHAPEFTWLVHRPSSPVHRYHTPYGGKDFPYSRDRIKAELRRRILLDVSDEDLVLYEGKLADEFGVSRTPIRQVIQALAAESLVEVRSGIGTIAPLPLPERRTQDLRAYAAILNAGAACAQPASFKMVRVELTALRMHLEADRDSAPDEIFFDVATRVIAALGELVDDTILKDTLVACFWRFVRRRISDHESDLVAVIEELLGTIRDVEHGGKSESAAQSPRLASASVEGILAAGERV